MVVSEYSPQIGQILPTFSYRPMILLVVVEPTRGHENESVSYEGYGMVDKAMEWLTRRWNGVTRHLYL